VQSETVRRAVRRRRSPASHYVRPARALPPEQRWARFGATRRSWLIHPPAGGLCIWAHVVVRRGPEVAFGRPRPDRGWPEQGGQPRWAVRGMAQRGLWRLPASQFLVEESLAPTREGEGSVSADAVGLVRTPLESDQ
jgi:hypothetical protein